MKLRRKICCQENISISSVGANENNKYVVTENDEINGTAERSNMDRVSYSYYDQEMLRDNNI